MNIPDSIARERYEIVRNEVQSKFPDEWENTVVRCKSVPPKIDIETLWKFGRDKPCWSNIKVNIGERIARDISLSTDFDSYETIASDDWDIQMLNRGRGWKSNSNFELRGESIKRFIGSLSRGGLSSYLWKMYAIRNLAIALKNDNEIRDMVECLAQGGHVPASGLKNWTNRFATKVGMGWGHVTVYHMLTDLGVAPKPDMHLRRSAIRMGLLEPDVPSNLPAEEIGDRYNHGAAIAVIRLSALITPTAHQDPRTSLREVDKILMEWSRKGLSRPI